MFDRNPRRHPRHVAAAAAVLVLCGLPAAADDPPSETPYRNYLRWSTASEADNFGYDVYRGESEDGPFERITGEPLLGAGTTNDPSHYEFVDESVDPYKTYWYYVESISMTGERERFSPVVLKQPKLERQPIATWKGGVIYRDELESWRSLLRHRGGAEADVGEIEAMLIVETLASAAVESGAERQPALASALAAAEERELGAALRRHRAERIEITGADVDAHLEFQPDAFHRPRKMRLRNLYKRFPAGASPAEKAALRARMEELRAELAAGADFVALARRESDSQTRFRGGLLGNVPAGQLRPEIDAAALKLKPGDLSPVVETEDGLTILRCDEIIEAYAPSTEEQRRSVAAHLRQLRAKQEWAALRAELLAAAKPAFDLGSARDPAAGPEAVVARFEGGRRTRGDLEAALASGPAARRDPAALADEPLRRVLEELVVQALAAERARALGLDRDPELRRSLAWRRRQLLAGDELARRVRAELEPPSEEQVRAWFEAHRQAFQRPPHYDLEVLRIDLAAGEERQRYRLGEDLRARLAAGELGFAAAARAHSDHPSADRGGALGWVSRRQVAGFGRVVLETVDALAPGELSELVQDAGSLYLLRLGGRQEARPLTWEEAAESAEQKLGEERVAEIRERIEAGLRAALEVRLVEEGPAEAGSDPSRL